MSPFYLYLATLLGFVIGWFASHLFRNARDYPIRRRRFRARRTNNDRVVRMKDTDIGVERLGRGNPPVRRVDVLVDRAEVDFVRQPPRFGDSDAV